MSMIKITIEDVAFEMWDCSKESAKIFAQSFLEIYPGFNEYWTASQLAITLEERL